MAGSCGKGIKANLCRHKQEKKKSLYNSSLEHNRVDTEMASISYSQKDRLNAESKFQIQSNHEIGAGHWKIVVVNAQLSSINVVVSISVWLIFFIENVVDL